MAEEMPVEVHKSQKDAHTVLNMSAFRGEDARQEEIKCPQDGLNS